MTAPDAGPAPRCVIAQLGLQPGEELEIKLGRKPIKLIPLGSAEVE